MAFKNEKISEQDRVKFDAVINYENLRKHARYISRFRPSSHLWWTLDRERDAYVIRVVGGGGNNWTITPLLLKASRLYLMLNEKG